MSKEEFIGKLQMVYIGDRNAFNDIVCAYDSVLSANEKAVEYFKYQLENLDFYEDIKAKMLCAMGITLLQNGSDSK